MSPDGYKAAVAGVHLTVVTDEMQAEVVCGLLRQNGIACSYRKTDSAGAISAYGGGYAIAGPTEILVDEDNLEAAQQVLARR
jgi:Putative prokaryotic signal transducing protein